MAGKEIHYYVAIKETPTSTGLMWRNIYAVDEEALRLQVKENYGKLAEVIHIDTIVSNGAKLVKKKGSR